MYAAIAAECIDIEIWQLFLKSWTPSPVILSHNTSNCKISQVSKPLDLYLEFCDRLEIWHNHSSTAVDVLV